MVGSKFTKVENRGRIDPAIPDTSNTCEASVNVKGRWIFNVWLKNLSSS